MPNYTLEQIQSDGLPWVLGYLLPVVAANTTITYGRIAELLQNDLELDGPIFSTQIGGVVGTLKKTPLPRGQTPGGRRKIPATIFKDAFWPTRGPGALQVTLRKGE